jgi:hypothetical protein
LENTRLIACKCQTVSSLDKDGRIVKHKKLAHTIHAFKPKWLKPDAMITFNERDFRLYSVFSLDVQWNEWDQESKAWESGKSTTREYYFQDDTGIDLCLINEDDQFYIREEVPNPSSWLVARFFNTKKDSIIEQGTYTLSAFLGEDDEPWEETTYRYQILADLNGDLTGEATAEDFKQNKGRFYRKTYLKNTELEGLWAKFNPEFESLQKEQQNNNFLRKVAAVPMVIFLFMWGFTFYQETKFIAAGEANFSILEKLDETSGKSKSLCTAKLLKEENYILNTRCIFEVDNGEVEIALSVIDKTSGKLINSINCSFFIETGKDNEGYWTEYVLSDDFQFNVPTSGEYEFIATPLQGFDMVNPKYFTNRSEGAFSIKINETKISRWYGLAGLLSLFFWLIYQWKWENLTTTLAITKKSPLNVFWDYLKRAF